MSFREIKPEELKENPFDLIGKQWMLITAGDETKCNTMTASWGGVGIMWGKPTATAYIRDSRFTKEFVDGSEYYTLSFFEETYRPALSLCGRVSGRDTDKMKDAGLTPYYIDGTSAIAEARLIFVCRKVFHQRMGEENFDDRKNLEKMVSGSRYAYDVYGRNCQSTRKRGLMLWVDGSRTSRSFLHLLHPEERNFWDRRGFVM